VDATRVLLAEVEQAKKSGVLRSLPRRPKIATRDIAPVVGARRQLVLPKSRTIFLLRRLTQWVFAVQIYMFARISDVIRRRNSLTQRGVRLRELFERVGSTGIKVGQQLSVRVDYFPYEICAELSKLTDRVPPFPLEVGIPRLEAAIGARVTEVFEHIDPKPIGSASLGCVFKGKLRTGEEVAIKIRRPGVDRQFVEDLAIIRLMLSTIEFFALVRPGFFSAFYKDLRNMLLEELDFVQEANYQQMYRKYLKRDKLRWLRTPKVFHRLSSHDVLITKFAYGFPCTELLKAVESGTPAALAKFTEANIRPKVLAKRIVELAYWSFAECPFFQGDPHPGNLILLPNSKICMIDFGASGISSPKQRAIGVEINKRLLENDVGGVAKVASAAMEPLPYIDTDALRKAAKTVFMERLIVLRTKSAQWWEKTTAAIWLSLLDATRQFGVPVNMDVLRMTRATLLYDTLAARLQPDIDILKEFRVWERHAVKRAVRRRERDEQRNESMRLAGTIQSLGELPGTVRRGLYFANEMTSKLPRQIMVATSAGAFIATALLRAALGVSLMATLAVAVVLLQSGYPGTVGRLLEVVQSVAFHPIAIGVAVIVVVFALRSVHDRLKDRDLQG